MRVVVYFLFMLSGVAAATNAKSNSDQERQIKFINLTQQFDDFWQTSRPLGPEKTKNLFLKKVAPGFPEFYDYKFKQWQNAGDDVGVRLKANLDKYKTYRTKFLEIGQFLPDFLTKSLSSFKQAFPSFDDQVSAYIINSLDEMDGGTREFNGKSYFIFGAESIAQYHRSFDYESKRPFLHHELFHVYHRKHFKAENDLLDGLWAEGLAVLTAKELNPKATLGQLSLDNPKGLMDACKDKRERLLEDIAARIKKPSPDDYKIYFYGSSTHPWIPKRSGYCIGYLFAEEMRKDYSLSSLATLDEVTVKSSFMKLLGKNKKVN